MFGGWEGVNECCRQPPPEERKCVGVVSDEKSRKKSFQLPPEILPHVLQVKNVMRVREEVGGGGL